MNPGHRANTTAVLNTPTSMSKESVRDISNGLNQLLADCFALYIKTKNFHWHMSGPHFRDYHLMLDEHADAILSTTDDIAERVRRIGAITIHSVGQIAQLQRIADNDVDFVAPTTMLSELRDDNEQLVAEMRVTHDLCEKAKDVASASLIENWIDQAEKRIWFLFEASRTA
ncbi:Dps family protein [Rhodoplanes sp. Z2-YC6860]|uniref:Dps family protein n=1 Tax=Rhodoplanes sp. Z2-YC6860 TaxID=674703 RepID=UPI00078B7C9C|nr:DNA starvation/stationary phase protection protein [Rhodoplanes sp. Z2-YC6860]AMN44704.1 ferritin Dps family protein [Rhodoplanes sp. Z2-YC6860]